MRKWAPGSLLVAGLLVGGEGALAQQDGATSVNATIVSERDAGKAAMAQAERLGNAGQKGPDSEACKHMTRAMSHYHAAAVAAGALHKDQVWATLSMEEMSAVERATGIVRHERYREAICQG